MLKPGGLWRNKIQKKLDQSESIQYLCCRLVGYFRKCSVFFGEKKFSPERGEDERIGVVCREDGSKHSLKVAALFCKSIPVLVTPYKWSLRLAVLIHVSKRPIAIWKKDGQIEEKVHCRLPSLTVVIESHWAQLRFVSVQVHHLQSLQSKNLRGGSDPVLASYEFEQIRKWRERARTNWASSDSRKEAGDEEFVNWSIPHFGL